MFDPTITVEYEGESFQFKNPAPRQYARVLARATTMRQEDGVRVAVGMDYYSSDLYFGLALFETLLEKADAENNWPFKTVEGKVVVASENFPPTKTDAVAEVGRKFLIMFFGQSDKASADGNSPSEEGVERSATAS